MFRRKWRFRLGSFFVRHFARSEGFLDPVAFLARLKRFAQPSDIWIPAELMRLGALLQARGMTNSQVIQHNLDWVWPYWVKRQFDPTDHSFIPRAFSIAHINLTHRNWTAIGVPDFDEYPLVDPRGLVTPHFDGWSVDAWILCLGGPHLIPSHLTGIDQKLGNHPPLSVETVSQIQGSRLFSRASVEVEEGIPVCRITWDASSHVASKLVVSVRPFNPEGVSLVDHLHRLEGREGFKINGNQEVLLDTAPREYVFSNYAKGDVIEKVLRDGAPTEGITCDAGMASGAAIYDLDPNGKKEVTAKIPLISAPAKARPVTVSSWDRALDGVCRLKVPEKNFEFLYETAIRTVVLHSPGEVYPGPYTYKRFWFRDAAYILFAMLSAGLTERAARVLTHFSKRLTPAGHFLSQDGEWDSNGQALWILEKYYKITGRKPDESWFPTIQKTANWIQKKRVFGASHSIYYGLLPAGFSAEHLGPNDFYYWDDFWSIAGLRAASNLLRHSAKSQENHFEHDANDLMACIEKSLDRVSERLGNRAMPASPHRRLDSGVIGSISAGYPLQLWDGTDARLVESANYLRNKCFLNGGFYQEIGHSGINAYLTLHVAQVLLRAGDKNFMQPIKAIERMATTTGQWPEAIHPHTGGGCMGDGQHVWASAEWILMMHHLFLREEANHLVLCPGISEEWLSKKENLFLGPLHTTFGTISITVNSQESVYVSWEAKWHGPEPKIEIAFPGRERVYVNAGETRVEAKPKR